MPIPDLLDGRATHLTQTSPHGRLAKGAPGLGLPTAAGTDCSRSRKNRTLVLQESRATPALPAPQPAHCR